MLISSAYAQGLGDMFSGSGVAQFLPLIMIFGVFYFLLIRPQQQKQKELRNQISSVRRGERVVMVQDKDGKQVPSQEIEVEIAKDVRVTVLRDTITTVIKPVAANDAKPVQGKAG